jgi:hypothetical protein
MAYGKPVVSKVSEKYPSYMTTVDTKVRARSFMQHFKKHFFEI